MLQVFRFFCGNPHLMPSRNYFLPHRGAHLLLQMNVHKAGHLSSKGQRAILIGFTAQSHYTAQLANIALRLHLLMRVLLLKNEPCHSASSGLLFLMSPLFYFIFITPFILFQVFGCIFVYPGGNNVYCLTYCNKMLKTFFFSKGIRYLQLWKDMKKYRNNDIILYLKDLRKHR